MTAWWNSARSSAPEPSRSKAAKTAAQSSPGTGDRAEHLLELRLRRPGRRLPRRGQSLKPTSVLFFVTQFASLMTVRAVLVVTMSVAMRRGVSAQPSNARVISGFLRPQPGEVVEHGCNPPRCTRRNNSLAQAADRDRLILQVTGVVWPVRGVLVLAGGVIGSR